MNLRGTSNKRADSTERKVVVSLIQVKVPDIGDFKDIPVIEVLVKPGDTVTVQGTKEKNGSVEATSISDTAKGVTSTGIGGGSFPSGFGGGTSASSGG